MDSGPINVICHNFGSIVFLCIRLPGTTQPCRLGIGLESKMRHSTTTKGKHLFPVGQLEKAHSERCRPQEEAGCSAYAMGRGSLRVVIFTSIPSTYLRLETFALIL